MPHRRRYWGGHYLHPDKRDANLVGAVLIVLTILIMVAIVCRMRKERAKCDRRRSKRPGERFEPHDPTFETVLTEDPIDALSVGGNDSIDLLAIDKVLPEQRQSVYDTMNRFYSTADVDPLIVGQGYQYRDYTRDVYEGRTATEPEMGEPDPAWGLQEFVSDREPGAVGVDIGPEAISEYEGSALGFSDGIPEEWAFPSTPLRWYRPRRADYYGMEGPSIVDGDKLYPIYVADHEPMVGED